LVVLRGVRAGEEFPLFPGRNTLGRFADQPVDVDLTGQEADGQVWSSRRHAAVTVDAGLVLVEDLNSLNGTWVNGGRIYRGQPRPLKPGDVIQIGTVQLRLVV
ncbi:MAG: FHA domain-containing protein, partial [Gemmataceae bacterium]|nr:FHA domain-containing protein [Gemmataceae bacterium]